MSHSNIHNKTMNPSPALKPLLVSLLLALPAWAAYAAEQVPNAGSILQQTQPAKPPTPASGNTGLTIEQNRSNLPPSAPFRVNTIVLSGNTLFDTATLHALVADAEGKELTLPQLNDIIGRITDYYRNHDYPLARAVIPAQSISGGVVNVLIVEARYGKVNLHNESRVVDSLLNRTLSPLQSGEQVTQSQLDHTLLLLSDVPGVAASATLKPGDAVGTSDLDVQAAPTPMVVGSGALDNYGNSYTGRTRLGGSVSIVDPLHIGDILNIGALTTGSGMNYGSLSYDVLVDGIGTRVGASYTALHYILSGNAAAADGHGTAEVGSAWVKQPLIRSREANLSVRLQYDHKQLDDDTAALETDRHLDNWTLSLTGDAKDNLLAGAANSWTLGWTSGKLDFDNAAAQTADAASARTQGSFSKWAFNYARLQNLSSNNALYVNVSGQWANTNLDSSEKMVAGGAYTVRAYDMGALSGDEGTLATVELRHDLGQFWGGQWQVTAFVDSEHVTINKNALRTNSTNSTNSATLSGVGVGLNWMGPQQWSAKAYVAAPIGATPSLIGQTNSAHAWVELDKAF